MNTDLKRYNKPCCIIVLYCLSGSRNSIA